MPAADAKTDLWAIASDHGGLNLKNHLLSLLKKWGYKIQDLGTDKPESVDYPDFAIKVAKGVASGEYIRGILVCGTGIGMSMTANRFKSVRAAVCTSAYTARMARAHNAANILCLGERVIGFGEAQDILKAFCEQDFEGGRHAGRVAKIKRG